MAPILSDAEIRQGLEDVRQRVRSMWLGDDGRLRRGHGGDLVTMLEDLGVPTVSVSVFERPAQPLRRRAG